MQRRSLVVLLATGLLALGALSVLRRPHEAGMRRLDASALAAADVDRIELRGARQVVLQREGSGWKLANGRAADEASVAHALQQLAGLRSSDFVTDDAGRIEALGLAGEGVLTVSSYAGGTKRGELAIAAPPAPTNAPPAFGALGPQVHVRFGDDVYAADAGLRAAFDRDAEGFEERTFWRESEAQLSAMQLRRADGSGYGLARKADAWQLVAPSEGVTSEPEPRRFDPQQASQQVARLGQCRAQALVDQDPGDAVTGLGDGADVVSWQLTPEAAAEVGTAKRSLRLGAARAEGGVWARLDGRALPFALDAAVAEGLRRPASEMADLTLMAPLEVASVRAFAIESKPGQKVAFRRTGDGWKLERGDGLPKGFDVDPRKLEGRMRQVLLSRALGVATDAKAVRAAKKGEGGRVTFTTVDGQSHALQFGAEMSYHGMTVRYARGNADGQAYYASKPLRDNVLGKLTELARPKRPAAQAQLGAAPGGGPVPQGLDSLPPEVQESIRKQLAAGNGP